MKSKTRYACAIHHNRGPAVCTNRWRVRRDRLEARLLEMIFGDVFSPETVAYVSEQVRGAVARLTAGTDESGVTRRAQLARARVELENIARAIRMGVVTATTKAMLEDAERRVAELEAAVRSAPAGPAAIPPVEAAVEAYLRDLRATLGTDIPARASFACGVGPITLRPVGHQLVAEMQGNLAGLLGYVDPGRMFPNDGAGRGILRLPLSPRAFRKIA